MTQTVPGSFNRHPETDTNNMQAFEKAIAAQCKMKLTGCKEDLNGVQNIDHPSGTQESVCFIKDRLVFKAQLKLNTLPGPFLLNSCISVGMPEKQCHERNRAIERPPGEPGRDGMLPPPAEQWECVYLNTI